WAVTAVLLGGLAWAFFKSERLSVRLGALGVFALYYVAMVLWAPTDQLWANVSMGAVLVIALGSRMRKPTSQDGEQGGPHHD
ncbi:MAG: hypothetical protein KDB60_11540, partial [Propionibacteriaceae bacterium]|nr:hypothetical protein [Propionibacteriaceae bacterium]